MSDRLFSLEQQIQRCKQNAQAGFSESASYDEEDNLQDNRFLALEQSLLMSESMGVPPMLATAMGGEIVTIEFPPNIIDKLTDENVWINLIHEKINPALASAKRTQLQNHIHVRLLRPNTWELRQSVEPGTTYYVVLEGNRLQIREDLEVCINNDLKIRIKRPRANVQLVDHQYDFPLQSSRLQDPLLNKCNGPSVKIKWKFTIDCAIEVESCQSNQWKIGFIQNVQSKRWAEFAFTDQAQGKTQVISKKYIRCNTNDWLLDTSSPDSPIFKSDSFPLLPAKQMTVVTFDEPSWQMPLTFDATIRKLIQPCQLYAFEWSDIFNCHLCVWKGNEKLSNCQFYSLWEVGWSTQYTPHDHWNSPGDTFSIRTRKPQQQWQPQPGAITLISFTDGELINQRLQLSQSKKIQLLKDRIAEQ